MCKAGGKQDLLPSLLLARRGSNKYCENVPRQLSQLLLLLGAVLGVGGGLALLTLLQLGVIGVAEVENDVSFCSGKLPVQRLSDADCGKTLLG